MMIIMLCDEVQVIGQPEGCFEPWMRDRAGKQRSLKSCNSVHQPQSRLSELGENLLEAPPVMPRLVSFPIAQVGDREFNRPRHIVVNSGHPQRLEVEQMAGMFLR
jgi:hypothetical protein